MLSPAVVKMRVDTHRKMLRSTQVSLNRGEEVPPRRQCDLDLVQVSSLLTPLRRFQDLTKTSHKPIFKDSRGVHIQGQGAVRSPPRGGRIGRGQVEL